MESLAKFTFEGERVNDHARAMAKNHVRNLEAKFGRIIACHVDVRSPSGHHRSGSAFAVKIRLSLPNGREVNVGSAPILDERHADIAFALNDAFHRARRQLQDLVRVMQGVVKTSRAAARNRV